MAPQWPGYGEGRERFNLKRIEVDLSRRTVLKLGPDDWARSRFVRSLLFETAQAVRVLTHPRQQVHQRAWLNVIDQADARAHLPLLDALNPVSGWVPDFLAPPPGPTERSVDDELAELAGYPAALIATDVRRSLDSHPTRARRAALEPLIADPEAGLSLVLAELRWAWNALVAPFWAPVRELITADIAFRSREIGRAGLGPTLAELHPSLTWNDGAITITPGFSNDVIDLAGRGLALMPSAFAWPDVLVVNEPPWAATLVYPARGIGDLWTVPVPPPAALAGVLGRTRALLITDLAQPSTTTALAARHHLSPAAVSTHLGRLRDAGLVASHRLGKEVNYQRTPLAEALIRAGRKA